MFSECFCDDALIVLCDCIFCSLHVIKYIVLILFILSFFVYHYFCLNLACLVMLRHVTSAGVLLLIAPSAGISHCVFVLYGVVGI